MGLVSASTYANKLSKVVAAKSRLKGPFKNLWTQ
jgi:hypothetical protein